jgi:hypothetical protein
LRRPLRFVVIAIAALLIVGIGGGYAYLALKDRNAPAPLTLDNPAPSHQGAVADGRWPVWDKHPYGTFTLGREPVRLAGLSRRSVADVVARGTLRLHDVDHQVEFPLQMQLSGTRFQVAGRLRTRMTSFGFDPPSVAGLTTVRDGVTIEVKLAFVRSG